MPSVAAAPQASLLPPSLRGPERTRTRGDAGSPRCANNASERWAKPDWKAGSSRAQSKGGGSDTELAGSAARKPVLALCYNPILLKLNNEVRVRFRPGVRGWAIWAASLAIVLLLNGIVWTLVIAR